MYENEKTREAKKRREKKRNNNSALVYGSVIHFLIKRSSSARAFTTESGSFGCGVRRTKWRAPSAIRPASGVSSFSVVALPPPLPGSSRPLEKIMFDDDEMSPPP